MTYSLVAALARGVLSSFLLAEVIGKIRHPCRLSSAMETCGALFGRWVRPFAYAWPGIEIALSLMLLLGWQARIVAALCSLLLSGSILVTSVNLARGRSDSRCGCCGGHRRKSGGRVLAREIALLLLSLPVMLFGGGYLAFDSLSPMAQRFVGDILLTGTVLPLALAGCGLYVIVCLVKQLVRLLRLIPTE